MEEMTGTRVIDNEAVAEKVDRFFMAGGGDRLACTPVASCVEQVGSVPVDGKNVEEDW